MTALAVPRATPPRFAVPAELIATAPPEARGLSRDAVRLLVHDGHGMRHTVFHDIGADLRAGDLLVVNTSATLPAAIDAARGDGSRVVVHFSVEQPDGTWAIEVRRPDQRGFVGDIEAGESLTLQGGATLRVLSPLMPGALRLWRSALLSAVPVARVLATQGRPIAYVHSNGGWPISAHQTVFAVHPGSAEMPSAARPFSAALVTALVARGVVVAPLTLHAGVSSLEQGEAPQPEWFDVPPATACLVNVTRLAGSRVIAVGTTVVRALESAAHDDGTVTPRSGWTDLVLAESRTARAVDGLITGWHDADSTHLDLLEAVVGAEAVRDSYAAALAHGYLWHEFGDSALLLRDRG